MQFKFYTIFALVLLIFILQEDQVSGQRVQNTTESRPAVQHRRVGRALFLIKTALVSGVIGFIAGLVVGKKKAYKKIAYQGVAYKSEYGTPNFDQFSHRSVGSESDSDGHEALYRTAAVLDNLGCGGRLLCELYQKNPSELDSDGRKLIHQFNVKQPPTVERLRTDSKAVFQYAAFVGASNPKDFKICSRVFDRCPLNAQEILKRLEDAA